MAAGLDTVTARTKLIAREAIYWQKLDRGCHLGFRKLTPASQGSWYARFNNADTGERPKKSLGEFGEVPANERFSAAKRAAEEWFEHLGRGGSTKVVTVKEACAAYVRHVRTERGDKPADDLEGRYRRWVDTDPIGKAELGKLTMTKVEAWRHALMDTRAKVSRDDRTVPLTRPRALGTVNRDMTALRAALNHAHERRHVTSDHAWSVALKPIEHADGKRELYLDIGQRRALTSAASLDIRTFLHCMSLVPLRPGALAGLRVSDFSPRLSTLKVGKDKHGSERILKLPPNVALVFSAATENKNPNSPLLTRADGAEWDKDSWKGPVKEAARQAGLSADVTAYTLRHSVITDLVVGGLDLLTVAQMAGTSVVMIEKHYGKLRHDRAAEALAALAL